MVLACDIHGSTVVVQNKTTDGPSQAKLEHKSLSQVEPGPGPDGVNWLLSVLRVCFGK